MDAVRISADTAHHWDPVGSLGIHDFYATVQQPVVVIYRWCFFWYFSCSPRKLGKIPILTNIFQMGWNHQLVIHLPSSKLTWRLLEDPTFSTGNTSSIPVHFPASHVSLPEGTRWFNAKWSFWSPKRWRSRKNLWVRVTWTHHPTKGNQQNCQVDLRMVGYQLDGEPTSSHRKSF